MSYQYCKCRLVEKKAIQNIVQHKTTDLYLSKLS